MKSSKRLIAFIMTLAMVLTMVPIVALAGGNSKTAFFDFDGGAITAEETDDTLMVKGWAKIVSTGIIKKAFAEGTSYDQMISEWEGILPTKDGVEAIGWTNAGTFDGDTTYTAIYPYDLSVAGTQVTSANKGDVLGDGKVSYDPTTKTLTLDNAVINSATVNTGTDNVRDNSFGIFANEDLTVKVVNGESKIKLVATGDEDSNNRWFGISTADDFTQYGNLTIKSDGNSKLTITSTVTTSGNQEVYAVCGDDVTIDGAKIIANTDNGICSSDTGDVSIINGANIDASVTKYAVGTNGNVSVKDSTIKVDGALYGIAGGRSVKISGTSNVDVAATLPIYTGGKIVFDLDAAGIVTAETKVTSGTGETAIIASEGIEINSEDGTAITCPTGGKVAEAPGGAYTIFESDGTTCALKVTIENKAVEHSIKEAAASLVWEKGCCDVLTITSDADYKSFVKILVDGVEVPEKDSSKDYKNYTVISGSTKVFLSAGYLETLSVGKHTIEIVSKDGSAKGTFTIVDAEKVADTADNSAIGAFIALGAFAAVGYVSLKKKED